MSSSRQAARPSIPKAAGKATRPRRHMETTLIHGDSQEHYPHGATLPPVMYSASFAYDSAEAMEEVFAGRQEGAVYSRIANPSVQALETRITAACAARGTVALASGMAAVTLALLGLLKAGDELIASRLLFGGTYTLLHKTFAGLGITVHSVNPEQPGEAAALVNARTRAVYLEAIANPAMTVPDLAGWRALCDRHGLALVLDATLLTPVLYDRERCPVDVAVFSASKYLAGAASVIGGLVVDTGRMDWLGSAALDFSDYRPSGEFAFLNRLRKRLMFDVGPTLAPLNAFLLQTGMESLALRMARHCENTQAVAEFLAGHPKVKRVYYPGLPTHPQHALCLSQYGGRASGVLSFCMADKAACFRFLDALRLTRRVTNVGDTKTIALHPASTIYATFWKHEQEQAGVGEDMIRLSVGIEHVEDILEDLAQALSA